MMYENYLEHHGVKGMRWGHRKQRYTMGYGVRRRMRSDANQPKTPEEAKRARRRQIAKRVAIGVGAAAAIGATAYAVHRVRQNQNRDIGELYRNANLAAARGDGSDAMNKFNSQRGSYSRRQLTKIAKAHKYGDEKDFAKAASVKADNRSLYEKAQSARYKVKHVTRDTSEKVASSAKSTAEKVGSSVGEVATKSKSTVGSAAKKTASMANKAGSTTLSATKKSASAVGKAAKTVGKGTTKVVSAIAKGGSKALDNAAQRRVASIAKRTSFDDAAADVDSFTRELLKKNAKRLAKAGR